MAQQILKTEKNNRMKMRLLTNSLVIFSILMFLAINVNITSANTEFEYQKFLTDNVTLEKFASLTYSPSSFDTVKSGNPYQAYVWYHGNVGSWNNQSVNNSVSYCSLKIQISKGVSLLNTSLTSNTNSTPYDVFNQNFTDDISDGKYFVSLFPYDTAYVYLDCKFASNSARPKQFVMPMDFSMVTPTNECRACQYFEWASDQVSLNKVKSLGTYTTTDLGYIGNFFQHFYDLSVIGFWILLILLLILVIGLMFFVFYWIFRVIKKYTK